MATLSVNVQGTRYVARTTPMMTLSTVVEDVCRQAKLSCSAADCHLRLGKQTLDQSTPVRFANLPSGSKLDLVVPAGCGRQLGVASTPTAPEVAAGQPSAATAPPAAAAATASGPTGEAAAPTPVCAEVFNAEGGDAEMEGREAAQSTDAEAETMSAVEKRVGRRFSVFPVEALTTTGSRQRYVRGPPDDFFEFTSEDFFRMEAAKKAKTVQEKTLMTKAMREARDRKVAEQLGPVGVRVVLPSHLILQAQFRAADSLSVLKEFVANCLQPGAAWYLYTTPPKAELKQYDQTFYTAGFVPAVKLYLGQKDADGDVTLREDVLQHQSSSPPALPHREPNMSGEPRAPPPPQLKAANPTGKKVPKWLKL